MKNLKNNKMLLGISITFLVLATISMSYAWFSATVKTENEHDQVVKTGTLELTYTDGPEIKIEKARPGQTLTKEVRVKNTGSLDAYYNLVWQELTNEITNDELVISIACKSLDKDGNPGEACEELEETPVSGNILLENVSIESKVTHIFTITITFKELNKEQNYNQGKNFSGVLGVNEYKDTSSQSTSCTYDGELTQGAEFVKAPYTYRYMQQQEYDSSYNIVWNNISTDGWGVTLIDKENTDVVAEAPCTSINDKPVVSMNFMFSNSKASAIDTSKFNTSNVTNMSFMFNKADATTLNLEGLDTSGVTDMTAMFQSCSASSLDVSGFDTSNVEKMTSMFSSASINEIRGLENFNTSKVTNMNSMFSHSRVPIFDLSNFDTSNVTDMAYMFSGTNATEINGLENFDTSKVTVMTYMFGDNMYLEKVNVSKFNTSNVTSMAYMFSENSVNSLDVSNFNTSKVTNMDYMFYMNSFTTIDLSSFDTSNVKSMSYMLSRCGKLITIYASDSFDTSKTLGTRMFYGSSKLVGGAGTTFNSSYLDKTYARIDGGPDSDTPGYFTRKTN